MDAYMGRDTHNPVGDTNDFLICASILTFLIVIDSGQMQLGLLLRSPHVVTLTFLLDDLCATVTSIGRIFPFLTTGSCPQKVT